MAQIKNDLVGEQVHGGHQGNFPHGRGQYFSTRQSKVDFPRFNGEDLNGWLYKCHQFFEVDDTPPEMKVKLATINLEGRALRWHQNWVKYKKGTTNVAWEDYVKALDDRFGDLSSGDPMAELLALKQSGTVSHFHDQFEFYLGRVELTEAYAVSFFLNGLKPVIQQQVRMFTPKTLNQAYTLAQLQETSLKTLQQELQKKPPILPHPNPFPRIQPKPITATPNNPSTYTKPFQRNT